MQDVTNIFKILNGLKKISKELLLTIKKGKKNKINQVVGSKMKHFSR